MRNVNFYVFIILLSTSCVQTDQIDADVNVHPSVNDGINARSTKVFKNREIMGFVNLIENREMDFKDPVSDLGEFKTIVINSIGKSMSMSYEEFYDRGGIFSFPVQKKGHKIQLKVYFHDGSNKVINI